MKSQNKKFGKSKPNQFLRKTVLYARIDDASCQTDLLQQITRLKNFCKTKNIQEYDLIADVVSEFEPRTKLYALLRRKNLFIVAENPTRFSSVGFDFIRAAASSNNSKLHVLDFVFKNPESGVAELIKSFGDSFYKFPIETKNLIDAAKFLEKQKEKALQPAT